MPPPPPTPQMARSTAAQTPFRLQKAPVGLCKVTAFCSDPDWLAVSAQTVAVWMTQQKKKSIVASVCFFCLFFFCDPQFVSWCWANAHKEEAEWQVFGL